MSFYGFLNDRCDIYHIQYENQSPGYGLPDSPSFSYLETPDLQSVPCHFGVKSAAVTIVQAEPNANYEARIKLVLPLDTDIRVNDKVWIVIQDTNIRLTFPAKFKSII